MKNILNKEAKDTFIDLHCHILPDMDDGAKTLEEAMALVDAQVESGVSVLALTPHFCPEREELAAFLRRRNNSFARLQSKCAEKKTPIKLLLGAEVSFSTKILEMDIAALCISGTRTLLIELPNLHFPRCAEDVLFELKMMDITPMLAHVERYSYVQRDPNILLPLIQDGVLMQANAGGLLLQDKKKKKLLTMLRHDFIHIMVSDTHSVGLRPPCLVQGLSIVADKLGEEAGKQLNERAKELIAGKKVQIKKPRPLANGIFDFFMQRGTG